MEAEGAGSSPPRVWKWAASPWWILLVPVAVLLVLYPAVHGEYVWDDHRYFREDSIYRDPARFWSSLRSPFVLSQNYFRPLTVLTFMLEMQIHGLDPGLSHWINLGLHALNAALVGCLGFFTLRRRPDRGIWATAIALFYGFHPAMAEGVAFISGRFDLMMACFLLLALLAEGGLRTRAVPRAVAVSLLFLPAALCKEAAVAFLLVLPLWQRLTAEAGVVSGTRGPGPGRKGQALLFGGLFLAGLAYLLMRYFSLGYLLVPGNPGALPAGPAGNHLLLVLKSVGRYAALLVWPFTLARPIHFSELPVPPGDWQAWIVPAGGLALLLLWVRYRKRWGTTLPLGFSLPILALLPVLNLVPLQLAGGAFAADRYLIFPLALFTLAAGNALIRVRDAAESRRRRRVRWPLILMLAWTAAAAAEVRWFLLPHWRNERSLWTRGVEIAPRSKIPHTNLSGEYYAAGDYESGAREARRTLDLDPDDVDALSNLGASLLGLNRMEEAIACFERTVKLLPNDSEVWSNLAAAYRGAGRLEDSIRALKEHALVINPNDGYANFNLGIVYQDAGHPDLAVPYLEKSIPLLPPPTAEAARQRLQRR